MGKKLIALILILGVLLGLSGFYVVSALRAYAYYQQSNTARQHYCSDKAPVHICVRTPAAIFSAFYPSYLATHTPLFSVEYSSNTAMTLLITVTITNFSDPETHPVDATTNTQIRNFLPTLLNNGQVLRGLTQDVHTFLHVQVTDTGKDSYYVNDIPLLLHSRWEMQWMSSNRLRIAAWVTPDDTAVQELVTRAAIHYLPQQQQPTPASMIGYTKATPQQVIDQVDAIYDTMREDYRLQYSPEPVPYQGPDSSDVSTEYIKLPFEVLQVGSGMCIELTTLLAAAVERVGLHAEIVIIPGHAFLGVAVTEDNKHIEYWDPVEIDSNVAAQSANIYTDTLYIKNLKKHTVLDTVMMSDARNAGVAPML
ncbi:MAG: hypothetical protein JO202_18600 [Ktedonobacteraceae bacterium]|nr:hypothetical protein [Ktedonobacteraceae bacterium]